MQIPEQRLNSSNLVLQAQQEVGIGQQSQSAVQASNTLNDAQYYQDYQKAVVVPTEDAANNVLNQTQLSTNSQPPILNQSSSVSIPVPPANDLVVTATDVQIVGASEELEQNIRKVIQTRAGEETSAGKLQQDALAILNTGLVADARVDSRSTPSGLSVVYQVEPVIVRSLQLSGAKALPLDVALDRFKPQLGNPISPTTISQSVDQINLWYAQNNYQLARVLAVRPSSDGVLRLEVAEGVVDDVKFRFFNEDGKAIDHEGKPIQGRTQQNFLRRELKIKPGQVFREDLVQQDLQQLYQMGLFQSVNVALEGNAKSVDVIYKLTEIPTNAVNLGGGYNQDSGIFGTVSYKDHNVGGINQQLGVDIQASPRDLQFGASFTSAYRPTNPDRLGYQIRAFSNRGISETFNDDINLPNDDKVRERQFGGSITLQRPIDDWQTSLGLNYTRTSIRDRDGKISPVDELGNPLSFSGTGIDDLATVSFTAMKDQRDNLINPTQGSVLSFSTEQSIPIGLGNISMNRLQANYSHYFPVDLLGKTESVLAFNIQGGTTIGDLPPYEAFNLGGVNSVRGYGLGDIGSGRSFVLASAEYRFPIFNLVSGTVFADFGSDLGSGDTVLGEPGVVRGKPGNGFGYGVGLRLDSPIGLIRADFGINDQGDSRLQLGIGQRF
ncbi:MAG: outer membrane protein assembly factor [Gloeocapsa sp. UFS-A4-WI-NPMV-4B04]|jgi:outer membrane protein insertion porin family|nr:outer membrane protein assembly factor [Gloeocapsa sp. UFS-A4-WI-NPMV-4B04]